MELRGRLALVRSLIASDAEPLARHANNPNIAAQLRDRFPHPYAVADARAYIASLRAQHPPLSFGIVVNGEVAGGIGFAPGHDVERFSAEIGYWLGEAHWGRGITVEAVELVSRHAFISHHLHRLFALPFADNAASIRVLEKAGYVREATLRASSVKNGLVRDQALYALVNADWKEQT
jgi:RimJ/RimL family protein N-acetyltransferase